MLPKFSILINLGIGLIRQTEEDLQNSIQLFEKRIIDLKELGEKEKTEMLLQIEELLKKGIRDSRKLESEIHIFFHNLFPKENSNLKISHHPNNSKILQTEKIKKTKKVRAA